MAVNSRWWTKETVAVVTGANKGIGFEIVRQFAENVLTVILTARDANRGLSAVKTLHDQGFNNVVFHELDIQKPHSVSDFGRWMKDNYGGLDILVNNAAIYGMFRDNEVVMQALQVPGVYDHIIDTLNNPIFAKAHKTNYELSKNCIEINYYGTKRITEELLPLLRPEGRIVNVSSEAGLLRFLKNDSLQRQLSDVSNITEEFIDNMVEMFLEDMKEGELEGKGWPIFAAPYSLSKIASNAYARLLAEKLSNSEGGKRIYVNCVHPGVVQTDMSGNRGNLTASQGAESSVMVALLPPGGPSGQFYFLKDRHEF
ncbi:salutaridine reductase [Cryptomeria japonica]|uniref:salutaridine reductase n=1 Tax=Cryptomeria japonica TaxID=3369 RepID=UPI0027DAA003|nr:salutaridine reductase [Cryptomeria japonica]